MKVAEGLAQAGLAFFDNSIDRYDYDAFGNLINQTGSTPNAYLFAGEAYDPALGLYYNRARYYNQQNGRFWSTDTYEGNDRDPVSLHKYLYAEADPVDGLDPSGHDDIAGLTAAINISVTLDVMPTFGPQLISRAQVFPVVVVTLPNGTSYTPMTNVKGPKQAQESGVLPGFPIPIVVPDLVDPQALVDQWRGPGPPAAFTNIRFAWFWRPGGPNDYKTKYALWDAFGNFEFGATGAAAGYDLETLAGVAQGLKFGNNSLINQGDIAEGFEAIANGGRLSKRQQRLLP